MYGTLGFLQAVGIGLAAIVLVIAAIFVVSVIIGAIKIVKEYERAVIFRLGRVRGGAKGPGLFLLIPSIDRMEKVDLRTVTMDVPPQDVITRDNVPVRVNAVVYFRVVDPNSARLGRHSTPVDVKRLYNGSYEQTEHFVSDSMVLRQFCRLYLEPAPDDTTLIRWANQIGPATVASLNERAVELTRSLKVTRGRKLRVDSTVVESDIHHPTDSALLGDGVTGC